MNATDESPLYIEQILIGPMQNFCYIVGSKTTREVVLIDPAWDTDALLERLQERDLKLTGVLVTHYHPDHCGGGMGGRNIDGVANLLEKQPVKTWVNRHEAQGLKKVTGLSDSDLVVVDSNDTLRVGEIEIEFLHTPGHTPGSQCFKVHNTLVSSLLRGTERHPGRDQGTERLPARPGSRHLEAVHGVMRYPPVPRATSA